MEAMRPVEVPRQDPPAPWWKRWGWRICAAIALLTVVVLRAVGDLSFWAAASIGAGFGMVWLVTESALTRVNQDVPAETR